VCRMQYKRLGRCKVKVSVAALGGGGASRLGLGQGRSEQEAIKLVHRAIGLGVNLFDTSEYYGTESVIGRALQAAPRDTVIVSSKKIVTDKDRLITPKELRFGLQSSLHSLKIDYLDIYHLHGVKESEYWYAKEVLAPELQMLKDRGHIRFIGITEHLSTDPSHRMLEIAVKDDIWDVIMVAYNLANPSACDRVLKDAAAGDKGVLAVGAARKISMREAQWMQFLVDQGGAESIMDAAYRFCRHGPGIHSVLFGTGNMGHLEQNIKSLLKPALPRR